MTTHDHDGTSGNIVGTARCDHTPTGRPANWPLNDPPAFILDKARLNLPLLLKVRDHINAHPEEHDQTNWAVRTDCGTAYCFAGWAAVLNGHELRWTDIGDAYYVVGGEVISITARKDLGLTYTEGEALFRSGNTRADIDWLLGRITGEVLPDADPTHVPHYITQTWWADIVEEREDAARVLNRAWGAS